jgi:hypothetical protein
MANVGVALRGLKVSTIAQDANEWHNNMIWSLKSVLFVKQKSRISLQVEGQTPKMNFIIYLTVTIYAELRFE